MNKIHKKSKEIVVPEQIELEDEGTEDDEEFDMNRLKRWENMASEEGEGLSDATLDGLFASQEASQPASQDVTNEDDPEIESEKEESTESLKQELVEVNIKLKSMEEEYAVMEANAKDDKATKESLEQALATNKQLLDVSEAKTNSLEMELEGAKTKIKRFEGVFKLMEAKEKILKDAAKKNVDPVTDKENKDLKEEVKSKKKEIEDANRKANDALKKLKQETNARSVAQAEIARLTKFVDTQASLIKRLERSDERSDENKTGEKRRRSRSDDRREEKRRRKSRSPDLRRRREKSQERSRRSSDQGGRRSSSKDRRKSNEKGVCWAFSKPGGCSYGLRCKYSHTSQPARSRSKERLRRSPSRDRGNRRSSSQEKRRERGSSPGRRRSSNYSQEGRNRRSRSREKEQVKEECRYWLQDTCSFGSKCRGFHDPSRRGIRRKEELRSNRENRNIEEPRSSEEPRSNKERRRSDDQDFLESLASRVSQGIARGCEALLPKLAPAPPAPLPQLAPAAQLQLAPAPQPSYAGNQIWRGQQPLADGSLLAMRQGMGNAMWDGLAGVGLDRLGGWRQ